MPSAATQTVLPFRDKEAQQPVAAILAPAVHAVVARVARCQLELDTWNDAPRRPPGGT